MHPIINQRMRHLLKIVHLEISEMAEVQLWLKMRDDERVLCEVLEDKAVSMSNQFFHRRANLLKNQNEE